MARKKTTKRNKAAKTRSRIDLFGEPSLLFGESEDIHNEIVKRVNEALEPTDIFEEFTVQDIVNSMMDSLRFARLKPELLNANMHKGLERVLEPLCDIKVQVNAGRLPFSADSLAAGWAAGDSDSIDAVEARMQDAKLSMDAVVAETLSYEMNGFEGMDRLATSAEARRHAHLREFERRRETKREASPPAVRISHLAAIDGVKANDNEELSGESEVVAKIEEASEVIERQPKAAGE
jgi:hypothetical protein